MPNLRLSRLSALHVLVCAGSLAAASAPLRLELLGTYRSGVFGQGGAEISAFDAKSKRLFVVNGAAASLTVLDLTQPSAPALLAEIPFGSPVNSVAVRHGLVAVAVEAVPRTGPGKVAFFSADFTAGTAPVLREVTVGAQPDMLTFTEDGHHVLVANEGEPSPDYAADPEGSVSIIDMRTKPGKPTQGQVRTVSFADFNAGGPRADEVPPGFRLIGPGATLAQDLEPEYLAISEDGRTAYATLQEHNGMAIIDIKAGRIEQLVHLGYKDHSLSGKGLDASDRDGGINIRTWPVKGMYQPDAIAAFKSGRDTYLITANEGDVRDWPAFSEERRIGALTLDPAAFPDAAELRKASNLGRLKVTSTLGDADGDGLHEELYAFGGRSFSIWDDRGALLFDSGDELEQRTAALFPDRFNASNDNNNFDDRSDDKGPEPEGVALGNIQGNTYAFIGLERIGGVAVYDLSRPQYPHFVTYANTRDFAGVPSDGTSGDLGPEGLTFIPKKHSPTGKPLLVVTYEVSGSVGIFECR
jgi:2',3'-cyclic-nucleotide 2'-phosphodiesterase/3'-nucleotidase/5'-nucleotidase